MSLHFRPARTGGCGIIGRCGRDRSLGSVYSVTRQPPLVGLELYSPHASAERQRLSTADTAAPCGGVLLARSDGQLIAYVAPG
jgi:hypothetical protein